MWRGQHYLVSNCRCMLVQWIRYRRQYCPNDRSTWKLQHRIWHQCLPDHPINRLNIRQHLYKSERNLRQTHQTTQNAGNLSAVFLPHQIVDEFIVVARLLHRCRFLFDLKTFKTAVSHIGLFHVSNNKGINELTIDRNLFTSSRNSFSSALYCFNA